MTTHRWDNRCADMELDRLQRGFTGYDHANFGRVLLMGFGTVVKDIHIESGSLLASSKVEPIENSAHRWEGQISVGGASAGVKNPVRYAVSELFGRSPLYGGPPAHDYFRNLHHIDNDLMGPVSSFISRGRRTPHPEGPLR